MESRLLRINSRFKQPNESNTDFSIIYTGVNIASIQLLKFSCMRLFPNIYPPYDTLNIDGQILTLPSGQYTATELAAQITSIGYACSLNDQKKFTFTSVANVIEPTKLSHLILGLPNVKVLTPVTSLSTPTLQGPDPIYVESNDLALSNCLDSEDSGGGNIPLVWSIPNTVPHGFQLNYELNDPSLNQIDVKNGTLSNTRLHLKITDQFGHVLTLPPNAYVDMIFKVFYRPNQ